MLPLLKEEIRKRLVVGSVSCGPVAVPDTQWPPLGSYAASRLAGAGNPASRRRARYPELPPETSNRIVEFRPRQGRCGRPAPGRRNARRRDRATFRRQARETPQDELELTTAGDRGREQPEAAPVVPRPAGRQRHQPGGRDDQPGSEDGDPRPRQSAARAEQAESDEESCWPRCFSVRWSERPWRTSPRRSIRRCGRWTTLRKSRPSRCSAPRRLSPE